MSSVMRGWLSLASGAALTAITANPSLATERMFIPLGDANAVVIIDVADDTVVGRIENVPSAHGLAGTPDGRYLIAGSMATRMPGAPPEKPVGVSEEEHKAHHDAVKPDDSKQEQKVSTVVILRQQDGTVVRRIDVRGGVHHVATSPDSRLAVVTHPSANGISVLDLESFTVKAELPTGPVANYAVFTHDGSRLYVTNGGNGTVTELDTKTWKTRKIYRVGKNPEHAALAPNGHHLYVNNVVDGSMTAIYLPYEPKTQTYPVGRNPHGVDVSDDNSTIYMAAQDDDTLVALNVRTRKRQTLSLAPAPYHLTVVRGKGKLYVSSAKEPKIWVANQADLTVIREIQIGGKGHQMVQSPRS